MDHKCSGFYQLFPHLSLLPLPSLILLLFLHYLLTMGKGSFQHDKDAQKKQHKCCLESGYILRAHEEEDAKWGKYHHNNKTRELHLQNIILFPEWVLSLFTNNLYSQDVLLMLCQCDSNIAANNTSLCMSWIRATRSQISWNKAIMHIIV